MTRLISFFVPEDTEVLAAFGELTLRHEHLVHILRMTVKTLCNVTVQEALDATAFENASSLRDRVRKLARQRLGEGPALVRLQALVQRCHQLTDQRNAYVHSVWAKQLDGEPIRSDRKEGWVPIPSKEQLGRLSEELKELTGELNIARLEGFIHEALQRR